MPGYKAHSIVGIVTGSALSLILQIPYTVFYILIPSLIGSLLPDLDTNKSKSFLYVSSLSAILCGILIFNNSHNVILASGLAIGFYLTFVYAVKTMTEHRGIFHSVPFAVIIYCLTFFTFNKIVALFTGIGFLSHLLLDEVWSAIRLKSSFGTAFKFKGLTKNSTIIAYLVATSLVVILLVTQKN